MARERGTERLALPSGEVVSLDTIENMEQNHVFNQVERTMKTILVPVSRKIKDAPDHLLFASKHLEKVGKEELGEDIRVKYIYYEQKNYGKLELARINLQLMWRILTTKHDILYFATDPLVLGAMAFLKNVGIYRKPMFAWKYIALYKTGNSLTSWVKKKFYDAFNCIFMITERHVGESIDHGMISAKRCKYIEWGEDVKYVDSITPPHIRWWRNDLCVNW